MSASDDLIVPRPHMEGACGQCGQPYVVTDDTVSGAIELLIRVVWSHQIDRHPIFAGSVWDHVVESPTLQQVQAQKGLTPLLYRDIIPLPHHPITPVME